MHRYGDPMKVETARPVHLKDYRPPAYLIDRVHLGVSLEPTRTRVRSKLAVRPNPNASGRREQLRLDGEQLELAEIALNGRVLGKKDYKLTDTSLTLAKTPAEPFTLEITTFVNPEANKALQGIYRSSNVYTSQCEAQGFRRITYFLDRPDVLATYTVRIDADPHAAPILLSNGNLQERGMLDGGKRHYAVWHDPHPKPCYLFALVGGDLAPISSTFRTMSGRKVDLAIYVEHGKEERAAWAMDSLKRSMRWDEQRFGREYDLDVFNIVAVSDFNMGAMENKGLNIFNDRLILASPETATDTIFEAIESVVAHEYFHNWTGNRITCRDWFQLCLKEGLTVYRDQEFSADERSATVQRIIDVRALKTHQFAEDAGPLAHPVRPDSYIEINNFYTSTVYEKGAEVVRMIATILGREGFRKGMDLYFERHDGEAATVDEFVTCFEDASGVDLTQFKLWYSQAGTPELVANLRYDKDKKTADLEVEQILPATPGQPNKKPMHIPIRLGLLGANGQDIGLKLDNGEDADRRRRVAHQAAAELPLHRCAVAPGALADARLLGPGQRHARPARRRRRVADGKRQRPVQSLAGGQQLCRPYAGRVGREPHVRQKVEPRPALCARPRIGAAGRRSGACLSRRVAEVADTGRRRPHHRQERRSGAGAPRPPRADEADRQDARAAARGPVRGDGRNGTLLARRAERRPPRPAQRRADAADGARHARRRRPPRQATTPRRPT